MSDKCGKDCSCWDVGGCHSAPVEDDNCNCAPLQNDVLVLGEFMVSKSESHGQIISTQSVEAKLKEASFIEKASALARAYGGKAAFYVNGSGDNQANFDIPPENQSAFVEELNILISLDGGVDLSDEEDDGHDRGK